MDTQIVAVFCLSSDMLKALHHYEDPQCQMADSEVMTTAIVAALYFGGNFEKARQLLAEQGYIPHMVYDGLGRFALSELSTGAQEQVLLALRLAFSRSIFGQESLFLILDDAFQHSDWQRRERLVAEMVSVARQGWQIIYFTMDDHIRDLFHQYVRPEFNDQYCFRDLTANVVAGS